MSALDYDEFNIDYDADVVTFRNPITGKKMVVNGGDLWRHQPKMTQGQWSRLMASSSPLGDEAVQRPDSKFGALISRDFGRKSAKFTGDGESGEVVISLEMIREIADQLVLVGVLEAGKVNKAMQVMIHGLPNLDVTSALAILAEQVRNAPDPFVASGEVLMEATKAITGAVPDE